MRSDNSPRLALIVLALLSCGVAAGDGSPRAMPKFRATTMDGRKFDNAAVKGRVVLLQFWATWCQYCRRDQSAVDTISQEFAGKGLLVLAVNAGESKMKVKQYLADSPRAVPIVLMENTNLAALFGARSYPLYVAIDTDGNIAGESKGSGGEDALRRLLRKAGLE